MPSLIVERLITEGPLFTAAIEHYNRFVQTEASTNAASCKATEVKLISQEPTRVNFLEFKLEYENPLDLLLLGHTVGVLMAEVRLRPLVRREPPS